MHQTGGAFFYYPESDRWTNMSMPMSKHPEKQDRKENNYIWVKKRSIHFQISIGLLGCHFDPEFPFTTPSSQPQMTGPANAGCQSISTVAGFEHGDSLLGTWEHVYCISKHWIKKYWDEQSGRYQQTMEFLTLNGFDCWCIKIFPMALSCSGCVVIVLWKSKLVWYIQIEKNQTISPRDGRNVTFEPWRQVIWCLTWCSQFICVINLSKTKILSDYQKQNWCNINTCFFTRYNQPLRFPAGKNIHPSAPKTQTQKIQISKIWNIYIPKNMIK